MKLKELLRRVSESAHHDNPNDAGSPCICSQCELAREAAKLLKSCKFQQGLKSLPAELTEKDLQEFNDATARIYRLLKSGLWTAATDIINVAGQRAGLRRMRALRDVGIVIEKRRADGSRREYEYRIVKPTNEVE